MGQQVSRTDYEWVYTEEPHKTRRKQILAKHPEVQKLMGKDPQLKFAVVFMVLAQIITAFFMRDAGWFTIFMLGYCWGGVINHSLTLAIHEISHNLAFGQSYPVWNRALGIFGNLPLGIPYSTFFKKYHIEHHKYQGDDEMDVDIPSKLEAKLFCTSGTKLLWLLLQPIFYAFRPLFLRPKPVTSLEIMNFVVQFAFDLVIYHFFGWRSLVYLALGTFLALGLHPVAGHFISEHYMFKKGYETYSYYGPLNAITFNVGYHNEHHDFPNIPGCNLPKLKELAPEYYDNLPCHTSWVRVLFDFVTDPEIGPYSRVKRRRIPFPDEKVE
ncbi:hypothetical protein CAPTEDRAFT_173907 [Capitella teleta]|uniref:sphingolipid 4-desaturase n=1 Tax=Capitella teleta TaxID=283909 RepID=R7V302_CAPTE|nr:hypothetical protein CAPTEDRAFT_173907 [Capitella teleta]|eukprot:ELU12872.1 hypothetical protein CAPTEDRAFT_173907 [Capitella teleta]